jgi:hypothetical protein
MQSYYELLAPAVARLEENTGDARRALYDRARTALVAQLRGPDPPLDNSDIIRERLALEDAICNVEVDVDRSQISTHPTQATQTARDGNAHSARLGADTTRRTCRSAQRPSRHRTPPDSRMDVSRPKTTL